MIKVRITKSAKTEIKKKKNRSTLSPTQYDTDIYDMSERKNEKEFLALERTR